MYDAGIGFCNYEEFESPDNRGQYNWTETIVSDQVLNLGCFYGAQIEENMDARATRRCTANLQWTDYDGSQCATRDTDRLRMLGRVLLLLISEVYQATIVIMHTIILPADYFDCRNCYRGGGKHSRSC